MKKSIAMLTTVALAGALATSPAHAQSVTFGDNSSTWANDDECDDPRFEGDGMAATLLDEDTLSDASDCSALFNNGSIRLRASFVNFGDNSSEWANDGECDDPRFIGSGMASTLLESDRLRDATDCQQLYQAGRISFPTSSFSFGDDSSQWANDGECDDPRFEGNGMATTLLDEDTMRDATDCKALYDAGSIGLKG